MSKTKITYGNIAVGAREDFAPEATDKESFSNISQLQKKNNYPNYSNPLDLYSTTLDGAALPVPNDTSNKKIAYWSDQVSGYDGVFQTPIEISFKSKKIYSSAGISLVFDEYNNIFCNHLKIMWYRNDIMLKEKEFFPNSANYVCMERVEYYNAIVIEFYSMNLPNNRLKLRGIEYGYGVSFDGFDLRNTKLIQEIDPISSKISINTADFTIDSKSSGEYSFESKQPISVYFDGKLKATTFVSTAKRKSNSVWVVQTEDYIGLMNSIPFYGDVYENKNAEDLLVDIFNVSKIPYSINGDFKDTYLSGYIPFTNCREALMQVAFAIGAVIDTSNSDVVNVFKLNLTENKNVLATKIFRGQTFEEKSVYTSVEIMAHSYTKTQEIVSAYNSDTSGVGEDIFVSFSEPLYDLTITNGEILESGTNYAVINANSGCVLSGKKYKHDIIIKKRKNDLIAASEIEKTVSVKNATLISPNNVDKIMNDYYDFLINRNTLSLKIVEDGSPSVKYGSMKYGTFKYGPKTTYNVGDKVSCPLEYGGNVTGIITRQDFNLNGNIIVKDSVLSFVNRS